MIPLWWAASVVLPAVEGRHWELKMGLLMRKFGKRSLPKLLIVFPVVPCNLPVEMMSGIPSLLSDCLDDALEAITFFDILFPVL